MSDIRVHKIWSGTCPLLGPALYVWVQGCPLRCKGCANLATLDFDGPATEMPARDIAQRALDVGGGLVLSGGEPFSQATGLREVCRLVRGVRPDTPILAYSGFVMERLLSDPRQVGLLQQIDVLVDGPFVQSRTTDSPLAGSANQRIICLSDRVSAERVRQMPKAHIQYGIDEADQIHLVGTGAAALDLNTLVERMRAAGVELLP